MREVVFGRLLDLYGFYWHPVLLYFILLFLSVGLSMGFKLGMVQGPSIELGHIAWGGVMGVGWYGASTGDWSRLLEI